LGKIYYADSERITAMNYIFKKEHRKKMAIIASYFKGETYGLLGPQMAATIIEDNTLFDCIVIAVSREDNRDLVRRYLADYFGGEQAIVGFSALSGREDLFLLAKELKDSGAVTILAGPQADVDYVGEVGWQRHHNRFKGLSENFTLALHGPAEQAIHLLKNLDVDAWAYTSGLIYKDKGGGIVHTIKSEWDEDHLKWVNWHNLYRLGETGFTNINITTGQVLQQIGCPYAIRKRRTLIDYPVSLAKENHAPVKLSIHGCSFCDVAADKGFYGELGIQTVIDQIQGLPELSDGTKIPFELINENPLNGLPKLLEKIRDAGIRSSQINLTLRADWLLQGEGNLLKALSLADSMGVKILIASIGFESFDDTILRNLNKGLTAETNLKAISLIRKLKKEYPDCLMYSREDGAIHGFIHPTPWDDKETSYNSKRLISMYGLTYDILPYNSTPLIIHHASSLGRWIRQIERMEKVEFKRYGNIIGWWQ
jgi:hypothetical protein